jgi:hypothetical protein
VLFNVLQEIDVRKPLRNSGDPLVRVEIDADGPARAASPVPHEL